MLDQETLLNLKKQLEEKEKMLEEELRKIAVYDEEDGVWEAKYLDEERNQEINADEVEEWYNQTAVVNVLVRDLQAVKDALQRMEEGSYGRCALCGREIEIKRLQVFPEATMCFSCAQKFGIDSHQAG